MFVEKKGLSPLHCWSLSGRCLRLRCHLSTFPLSAWQSKNYSISSVISTNASTLNCTVEWNATVHGKNAQGVVDER